MTNTLSFVVEALTFLATWLIAKKYRSGFAVGMGMQPLWIWLALVTGAYGLGVASIGQFAVYAYGWQQWGHGQVRQQGSSQNGA